MLPIPAIATQRPSDSGRERSRSKFPQNNDKATQVIEIRLGWSLILNLPGQVCAVDSQPAQPHAGDPCPRWWVRVITAGEMALKALLFRVINHNILVPAFEPKLHQLGRCSHLLHRCCSLLRPPNTDAECVTSSGRVGRRGCFGRWQ